MKYIVVSFLVIMIVIGFCYYNRNNDVKIDKKSNPGDVINVNSKASASNKSDTIGLEWLEEIEMIKTTKNIQEKCKIITKYLNEDGNDIELKKEVIDILIKSGINSSSVDRDIVRNCIDETIDIIESKCGKEKPELFQQVLLSIKENKAIYLITEKQILINGRRAGFREIIIENATSELKEIIQKVPKENQRDDQIFSEYSLVIDHIIKDKDLIKYGNYDRIVQAINDKRMMPNK